MKLMLTGGAGMLGSSISRVALEAGIPTLAPKRDELDLLDTHGIHTYLDKHKPDRIIHAAARVGGIGANINQPQVYLTENIIIDSNLLNAANKFGINQLLYIGSSCMYPRNFSHPIQESDILTGPLEPTNEGYALSKLVGWKTTQLIANSSNRNWKTVILSNLYGPGDHFESGRSHLLAAIIEKTENALSSGTEVIEMWGDGFSRREFTYVNDVAEFLVSSISSDNTSPQTLNVGSGVDYSVREYYEFVAKLSGFKGKIIANLDKPSGMKRKLMDVSLAQKHGWSSQTSIEEGILKTIDWYRANRGQQN